MTSAFAAMLITENRTMNMNLKVISLFINNHFSANSSFLTVMSFYLRIHKKKRGATPVTRSTCRGSGIAQFAETSNAESPTPDVPYIETVNGVGNNNQHQRGLYRIHPMRRSRCFVFDKLLWTARFLHVKTKAYSYAFYVYASRPASAHWGLSANRWRCKFSTFLWKGEEMGEEMLGINDF